MKRALVLIIALLLAVSLAVVRYYKDNTTAQVSSLTPTPTLTSQRGPEKTSLFVPYWTLSGPLPTSYDRLIYFGVTPGSTGIDRDEIGYQKLREFLADSPTTAQRYLTLRMLDNTQNFTILKDTTSQKSLITDTVSLAKRNDFQGIVLDLEVKALPFDSLMKHINNFVALFAS